MFMEKPKSTSQENLDETFESTTAMEPEEPPADDPPTDDSPTDDSPPDSDTPVIKPPPPNELTSKYHGIELMRIEPLPMHFPLELHIESPPAYHVSTPKSEHSKIKQKLSALASPFKTSKGFRLGSFKKGKSIDDDDAKYSKKDEDVAETEDADAKEDEKQKSKKKNGARSKAGAFVKRLGSFGGRRQETKPFDSPSSNLSTPESTKRSPRLEEDGRATDPSFNDATGSRYGSTEDVDMQSPITDTDRSNLLYDTAQESASAIVSPLINPEPIPLDNATVAANHPVSTKPFAVSTWKPKSAKSVEIPRPIESPSPEDALRRRISFVKQATYCLSEDRGDLPDIESSEEDSDSPGARLSRMVELARLQRHRSEQQTPTSRSTSPSPSSIVASVPAPLPDEKTDDEEYVDTEGLNPMLAQTDMPPYGDLIVPEKKPAMGTGTSLPHTGNPTEHRKEYLYKILVIGELGTGKTSIIKRYVHQFFSQHYRATIGVDFALKVLNWDPNVTIRLQLWDIAGQERFGNMTRVYYKEAVGAFIVFDVSRVSTFEAVVKWKQDLDSKVQLPDGSHIPCILLGNKSDQQKEGLVQNPAKMEEFCREKGFNAWFETSAKENINIEEAARALVTKILSNEASGQGTTREVDRILLDEASNAANTTKKKCTC